MKKKLDCIHKEEGDPKNSGGINIQEIRYLLGKINPLIIEVGANTGQTTIELLKYMPEATIYCFEPEPKAIIEFKKNVNYPNVHLIESAVGNENGSIVFHQSGAIGQEWNQSGSIRNPTEKITQIWPWLRFPTSINVPITRLDDWVKTIQPIFPFVDLIWADTQGAESDLILGALDLLSKTRFLYSEYGFEEIYEGQASLDDINNLLTDFSITRLFGMDALFENINLKDQIKNVLEDIPRVGRNELCLCGSGVRYKNCHGKLG